MRNNIIITGLFLFSLTTLGISNRALADGGAIRVHNNSSTTVTVNSESGYCCTADSGDTCSCVVSTGKHKLTTQRHDNSQTRVETVDVPAEGFDFNLNDTNT